MSSVKIEVEGFQELESLFQEMMEDFGAKDQKKILRKAASMSMQPVLQRAKTLAPVDTGAMAQSLRLASSIPSRKAKRSIYINDDDTVISTVTSASGKQLAKLKFYNYSESYKQKEDVKTTGVESDARVIANEFGTGKMPARPFLRPALESQSFTVVNSLGDSLAESLRRYRARTWNKTK
jgi:HK97 gp10 family phage protein